jgi:peptidoglycan/LPS O-acetylase OafA/YrhL
MNSSNNSFKLKATESTWAIFAITRFLLAFVVLIHHIEIYFDFIKGNSKLEFIASFGGKASVLGFLLISGISIGHSFYINKDGFLIRRFLRIYPLYFFAVLFTVFLQYGLGSPYQLPNSNLVSAGIFTSIGNLLLLQGIAVIPIIYNYPLWSLGVECFLYLMVPLLFRLRLRYILVILVISICTFLFKRDFFYGYIILKWAWPFIIGLIIVAKKQTSLTILLLIAMPIITAYDKISFSPLLSWLNVSLVAIICLFSLNFEVQLSKTVQKVFNFLGTISYPIYVLHLPILLLLYHCGITEVYTLIGLVILITIPLNYIFDDWLKRIFWKPLVSDFNGKLNRVSVLISSAKKQIKL